METFNEIVNAVGSFAWGPVMIALIALSSVVFGMLKDYEGRMKKTK